MIFQQYWIGWTVVLAKDWFGFRGWFFFGSDHFKSLLIGVALVFGSSVGLDLVFGFSSVWIGWFFFRSGFRRFFVDLDSVGFSFGWILLWFFFGSDQLNFRRMWS